MRIRSRNCVAGDRGRRNRDGGVIDIDTAAPLCSCIPVDRGRRYRDRGVRGADTTSLISCVPTYGARRDGHSARIPDIDTTAN
ncbi:hypothetical protein Ctob_015051 [Chrysochromulina tobinii]|uniref:Uncharacterized protein n=1 Tax=Chrysochromulina tobinii TaxID=1460289 RepID=A0A0M0LQJ0_9EUKA|nr:hypothetical protein Ctob_015051 [Chrysochromulina tobinii]|eukprot:KOO53335.1 hypothetical protein Ctob_015051 [Chrysochromulina sp. CCMP291]